MISPIAEALLFAVFGLVFGSLASALSYRLPRGMPVGADRSRCQTCGTSLTVRDLVPLLSWLSAKGRCRYCGAAVSWRYPLIEATTSLLFFAAWLRFGADPLAAAILALSAFALVVIVVADCETGFIPDAMTILLGLLAIAARFVHQQNWLDGGLGAVLGFGLSWAISVGFRKLRGRQGLGFGDVKFLGAAGFYVGLNDFGIYLAVSGILGIALGVGWRAAGRGAVFPFGPALCVALLAELYGLWNLISG